ncbi:MAG TPA: class I SAM-dependent methyltransferase [Gemmatimonadaceae bacterium]
MTFKDHFSQRAALYAACRPHYPDSLFRYVASVTAAHDLAIDCGTGNGQAAIGLAEHFTHVIAIDPSSAQIDKATPRANVEYRVAPAEQTGAESHSADLVTAAQALHWLNAPAFFAEATRLLKSDGAIAVWGYGDPVLDTQHLQNLLHTFNRVKLEQYWFAERQLLLDGYQTIDFPFVELTPPPFELRASWTLAELLGYLRTWSSAARYAELHGVDPVSELEPSLASEWGDPATARPIRWPLHLRVGKLRA